MNVPPKARYVIVGAGIHGLSTAWHLATELRERGLGDGGDVLVVDKTDIGAGASGVACGVIRNNYFQPAMRRLMAHSVDVWESDPEAFSYHGVGYIQAAPDAMRDDVVQIHAEQQAIGYESVLVEGVDACHEYMHEMFSDWQAPGVSVILHEKRGGYANNVASLRGLADKVRDAGVTIATGVTVTGMRLDGGRVAAVETDAGAIECEHVVAAAGPWVRDLWAMLDLPSTVTVRTPDGRVIPDAPMWTYWALQEGILDVDPQEFMDNRGEFPPVIHVDSDAPLYDDVDGTLITDQIGASTTSPTSTSAACRAAPHPSRSGARPTPSPSTRTGRRARSSSSARTSCGCGPPRWPPATSASRGAATSTARNPRAGSGPSPRTASRCSTRSGRTPTSSPTPTTATR